ncbi:hypothetical protein [Catalinimonas alkaloidigena]|nr:hypothetical protein [Catalinimonas alkaloidigena]
MDLKKHGFVIVSLVLGAFYSILCLFFFNRVFVGVTTIYFTLLSSSFFLWLETRQIEIATKAQFMQFLSNRFNKVRCRNLVWIKKAISINRALEELTSGRIELSPDELDDYTIEVLNALVRENTPVRYWATHNINNSKDIEVWGEKCPYRKYMNEFIEPQRNILNRGGEVVRIFIVSKDYASYNKNSLISMLEFHDKYYENTLHKVSTLVYVPSQKKVSDSDFTVINNDLAFEWIRSNDREFNYSRGFCYSGNKQNLEKYISNFSSMKSKSISKERIITL